MDETTMNRAVITNICANMAGTTKCTIWKTHYRLTTTGWTVVIYTGPSCSNLLFFVLSLLCALFCVLFLLRAFFFVGGLYLRCLNDACLCFFTKVWVCHYRGLELLQTTLLKVVPLQRLDVTSSFVDRCKTNWKGSSPVRTGCISLSRWLYTEQSRSQAAILHW